MKKTALLLLITLGLSPVLFGSAHQKAGRKTSPSSRANVESTAGNRTGSSYLKATAGTFGVQWTGGNNVSK